MAFWREFQREVQTTFGRRRASSSGAATKVVRAPPGVQGLVVEEDEGGWDVVDRKVQEPPAAYIERRTLATSQYLVGGEAGAADEEDAEYRRIWNLPMPNASTRPQQPSSEVDASATGVFRLLVPPDTAAATPASQEHGEEHEHARPAAAPASSEPEHAPSCAHDGAGTAAVKPSQPVRPPTLALVSSAAAAATPEPVEAGRRAAAAAAATATSATSAPSAAAAAGRAVCASAHGTPIGHREGSSTLLGQLGLPEDGAIGSPASSPRSDVGDVGHFGRGDFGGTSEQQEPLLPRQQQPFQPLAQQPPPQQPPPLLPPTQLPPTPPPPQPEPPEPPVLPPQTERIGSEQTEAGTSAFGNLVRLLLWLCSLVFGIVRWSVALAVHSTLGLLQAHHPWLTLVHVLSNVHSRKCVMQCVMLNVLLFRGALHVYEKVLPRLCVSLLGVHLLGDWKYELAIVVLWAVPAYVICEIVSTTLLFKMAKQMATATPPPPPPPRAGGGGGAAAGVTGGEEAGGMVSFTSIVYTRLIYIVFVLQVKSPPAPATVQRGLASLLLASLSSTMQLTRACLPSCVSDPADLRRAIYRPHARSSSLGAAPLIRFLRVHLGTPRLRRRRALRAHRVALALLPRLRRRARLALDAPALLGPLCAAHGALPDLHCQRTIRTLRVAQGEPLAARLQAASPLLQLAHPAHGGVDRTRQVSSRAHELLGAAAHAAAYVHSVCKHHNL